MSSADLGTDGPDQSHAPARRRTVTRVRAALAAILTLLLVLGLVAGGYLLYRSKNPDEQPLNPFSGAPAVPSDGDRREVSTVAEQFALRMDAIDGTHFSDYVKRVEQLMTTKAKTKNTQVFDTIGKSYAAAKVKGTGKVLISGVADLGADSATVLVAHDASVTTSQGNIEHHYRWTVSLVKVRGTWLVDDFNPVS